MKKTIVAALVACMSFGIYATDWVYDSSKQTISDGEWTFAATVSGTELTVGTVSADPGAGATLDFSKPITDGDSTTYTLVTLDPNFSAYANKTNLKTLVLPATGLTTISANAFKACTALTSVTPFLPDSVTTVGNSAFYQVPVEDSLSLKGVVTVESKAFGESSVTNIAFGPSLKVLRGGWDSGCFWKCLKLVTVTFDSGTSGATLGDGTDTTNEQVFGYDSKLTGSLDLRGFTTLGMRPFYGYGGSVTKLALSSQVSFIAKSFFHSFNAVKKITFDGAAPAESVMTQLIAAINDGAHTWSEVYFIVPEANKDSWAPYCENGEINNVNSHFSPELIPAAKTSNIYLIYKSEGGGGEKGYWVYDGTHVASTNGLWKFEAATVGAIGLSVGACVKCPETAGKLDFSQKVTDGEGNAMVFSTYENVFHTGSEQIAGYDKVTSLVISSDSTSVGVNAFRGCTAMTGTLKLPDLVTSVGENAFYGCTGITALRFGSNFASVGPAAFRDCTALESLSPCFPNTLTVLGKEAFWSCPITNACVMKGIVTIRSNAIRGTRIPSIYIGPNLELLDGGYENGCIYDNAELTGITFDEAITNASMPKEYALAKNPKLTGTIDLRGFSDLGSSSAGGTGRILRGTAVTSILFSADLADIPSAILDGLHSLQTVTFFGAAPTNVGTIFDQPTTALERIKADQNVVTYVYWAHRDSWASYAEFGVLNGKSSTWASKYVAEEVTDLSKRKLLLVDPQFGLIITIR